MNTVLLGMNRAPLFQTQDRPQGRAWSQNNRSYQQNQKPRSESQHPLASCYALLDLKPNASKEEVKRAYRRQMSLHHPDKLMAQGLSDAQIKAANNTTQAIRKAYDQIRLSKGW